MSFNRITLIGNLGRDPELRYSPQGTPIAGFSMATNERRKDKNGDMNDITTWFRVTLFGRQAELAAQHLVKGRQVYIEGRLRQETYVDRDGKERTSLEVVGDQMQFIGGPTGESTQAAAAGAGATAVTATAAPASEALSDDDIPF